MKRRNIFDCTRRRNPGLYDHIIYGISFHADTPFRATKYWIEHPDNKGLFNNSKSDIRYDMNDITDYAANLKWFIFTSAFNEFKRKIDRIFQKEFQ